MKNLKEALELRENIDKALVFIGDTICGAFRDDLDAKTKLQRVERADEAVAKVFYAANSLRCYLAAYRRELEGMRD